MEQTVVEYLKKTWRFSNETPSDNKDCLVEINGEVMQAWFNGGGEFGRNEWETIQGLQYDPEEITRWAYLSDIMPKGGDEV